MEKLNAMILLATFSTLLIQAGSDRLVGGPQDAQLSDERKNQLAVYAVDTYNIQCNCISLFKLIKINKITSQEVVNGTLYEVDLEIAETVCRKGFIGKECKLKTPDGSENKICTFEILEQPSLKHRSARIISCSDKQA